MLAILEEPTVPAVLLTAVIEVVRLLHSARSAPPPQPVVIVVDREPHSEKGKK
ncbi:hypothetical protein [Streptomyces sp. NPDC048295]|uniref:hypothetical protein n=1 Tax=Streptomyces sp. NPDC048295 TaxID=3154617 RepID=UPI003443D1A3